MYMYMYILSKDLYIYTRHSVPLPYYTTNFNSLIIKIALEQASQQCCLRATYNA